MYMLSALSVYTFEHRSFIHFSAATEATTTTVAAAAATAAAVAGPSGEGET